MFLIRSAKISVTRSASELDGSWHDEALFLPVEWILAETREPCRCYSLQLFRLQLHQDSSYTSHVPGNGPLALQIGCGA
jgi:hypothetical protein